MDTILGVVANVFNLAGDAVSFMNTNPVCWAGVAFGLASAAIGLVKKATKVGGRKGR